VDQILGRREHTPYHLLQFLATHDFDPRASAGAQGARDDSRSSCEWVYSNRDTFNRRQLERYFGEAGLTMPTAHVESHAPAI
jgi:hypothetical protein